MTENFFTRLQKDEKYIMKCCYYVFAVNGLYGMIMGSLLPYISDAYNLSDTISGSLISSHYVGNLLASFIAGILPLYLGRKRSIIFLSSFVTIGFAMMIVTGNPLLLLLSFFFTGVSRGSISNFNNTIVNEISDSSPAAMSFLHSVFAIGALLAPYLVIVSSNFFGLNGWRVAAGVIIVLTAISIPLFSRMKMKDRVVEKGSATSYEFMKQSSFWISAGILFFYLCGESTINGWLVKYFVDSNILTIGYSQFLASLLWMGVLIGRLSVSAIGDRFARRKILYVLSISTTIFFIILLSSRNQTVITITILGLGLSMAGIYPTTVAATGKFIKEYPMAMGVLLVLGGIGSIVMPTLTGALSDRFGLFYGMAAIGVALGMMILCVFLYGYKDKNYTEKV
ncbi:MFS transporter [Jeotgalibaca sp. MA1X17-3]|uniref:MFS transporter n=1 Tax=Jeotgalibaca sp. MA1X17-3 TaxID=2908211 RepID=UPI001F35E114|nr:MFS transporter [Jeotgalibaca sp. MA1X17-3]UJF15640.1 MFS transporter [Jeotgalibaca sp. MA1X17-3]